MVKTIFSIAGLMLAGGIFFLYTQPTYDNTRILQEKIVGYDRALEKAAELQELKQSLLSRYNAFDPANLDRLRKLLPDHVDNVRLILDLDNLAGRHGMALQNVVVSNPASEPDNPGAIGAINAGAQQFDSLTLKFSTHGSYKDFLSFLRDTEASLRIVDLVSLNLTGDGGTNPLEPTYRYDITIRTYWLK